MKAKIKFVIFAVVFGSVFNSSTVSASTLDTVSKKAIHLTLANGREKIFEQYVNENFANFVQKEDWKKIVTIVTLYNQSPSKLLKTDVKARQEFNDAIIKLNNQLSKSVTVESKSWLQNVNATARTINYIWNQQWNGSTPAEATDEAVEVQVSEMSNIGR